MKIKENMELDAEPTEEIVLPKPHLSWSQMALWRSSKKGYATQYFENGKKINSKYLTFGSSIAEQIEEGTYRSVLPNLPTCDTPEFPVRVDVGGVPIFSKIDSYDSFLNIFYEYKTGKRDKDGKAPWNDHEVQKHDQLLFYAVALRRLKGVMPEFCELHWIETYEHKAQPSSGFFQNESRGLQLTGHHESFTRTFDERELDRFEKDIIRVAKEISNAYKLWLSDI